MAKAKESKRQPGKKPPSRRRYEEEHPTKSFRLNRQDSKRLDDHLRGSGCSLADFVKDAIGREKAMVQKRVETLAAREIDPSLEDRVKCLENLVHELFSTTVDTNEYPPYCPRCENQELIKGEGMETESRLAQPWVITWKCPKCGFFINTYKRIDPESIKWINPGSSEYINMPKTSARHRLKKRK